ncbi:hypothetical protein CANINC_004327 [Pichia inconspicua]|uniref:Uncharacterized protein n=1 Tax=Pichia inconspicua TaxID=52247 RepID=A0A4V4NF85_9ASCO|nr:hypothetical protein CANINC_004327 [[Candida] inconspicua]
MTKDKKKRLSIYDIFGRSSSDNTTKSKSQKSRPKSLSAIKSTPNINQKNKHNLTFTLPDESITNIESSNIPVPKPRDKRSSLLFAKSPISESSKNSSQVRISSPISPVAKNTLPMDQNQTLSTSRPLVQNSNASGTSLTSSVYPSSRNVSSSTIDFSRQTSSIYPPSTIANDNKTIVKKRMDLMAKRKPPVPLSIQTESTIEKSQEPNESTEKRVVSAADSYESSEGGFTPLQLMPILNEVLPLSSSKQLNTAKNAMFDNISGTEYEPPSFDKETSENSNAHKHSRTLSSIEEITSALEKFQIEHERSFQEFEPSRDSYLSNTTDDHHTVDMREEEDDDDNLNEKEGIYLKVEDLPHLEEGENLDNYIEKLKSSPAAHVVTETKDHDVDYTDYSSLGRPGLTNVISEVSSGSDIFYDSNSRAETPKLAEGEVFNEDVLQPGDVVQVIHMKDSVDDTLRTPTEDGFDIKQRARVETLTDNMNTEQASSINREQSSLLSKNPSVEAIEVPESLISDFNYDDLSFIDNDDEEDYSKDDDLIGPLNKSFDSFVAKVRTRDSKISDNNTNSIISGSLLEMDDGDWKRYDSATTTNFFHPPESHDLDEVSGLIMPQTDLNQYDNEVVTPTEQSQNELIANPETPRRELDLENELDDNIIEVSLPHDTDDSLNELYPRGSSSDDNDDEIDEEEIDRYGQDDLNDYNDEDDDDDNEYINGDDFFVGTPNQEEIEDREFKEVNISTPSHDECETGSHSILEFSPKSQFSFNSPEPIHTTPEIYRGSFQFPDHIQDSDITGTPTDIQHKSSHHFVIANDTDNRTQNDDDGSSFTGGNYDTIPIDNTEIGPGIDESIRQSTYDRRETPIVKPIEHSMVVAPAVPLHTSHTLRLRRPPPNFPSSGRRSRALSESTKDPELFMNGLKNQVKSSESTNKQMLESEMVDGNLEVSTGSTIPEDSDARKGEKCAYIENLRNRGKKTVFVKAPSSHILPLSIKQNGKISHKKIPSVQLLNSYKSKHIVMKPKTRMLASEIDDGELPDATLVHSAQKTKVPIHPDADVIEASEQFNRLAKRRSQDLARNTSIMSVRPHYGAGMRLFVTNPDGE